MYKRGQCSFFLLSWTQVRGGRGQFFIPGGQTMVVTPPLVLDSDLIRQLLQDMLFLSPLVILV